MSILSCFRTFDKLVQRITFEFVSPANGADEFAIDIGVLGQVQPTQYRCVIASRESAKSVEHDVVELQALRLVHRHNLHACNLVARYSFGIKLLHKHRNVA